MLSLIDKMTFSERWFNAVITVYEWFIREVNYFSTQEEFTKRYFAHLAPLPSVRDLMKNVSLTLVNSHRAIIPPRPTMPSKILHFSSHFLKLNFALLLYLWNLDVISIGGAHIRPAKPLPNELQTFLDGAQHGAIYFSLGSVLEASYLSKHLIQAFLGIFFRLW